MSWLGELWTVVVLLAGVATLFYTASTLMALVVEGGLYAHFTARRFNRMLERAGESLHHLRLRPHRQRHRRRVP